MGIVGVGFVGGQAHAPAFKRIPNSRLIALSARTKERVKPIAEKYNVTYMLDHNKLISQPDIDAVVVATPTPLHYDVVKLALENRKHVLCEMPLTPSVKQSQELGRLAKKVGVILMPVLNFRFTPNYLKVKELLTANALDEPAALSFVESIPARDLATQWPAGSWAWDKEASGGYPDFTLSVWSIDLIRWLFEAEYADTHWKTNYLPLKDLGGILGYSTMGLFKLTNGVIGSLHYTCLTTISASQSTLEILGRNTFAIRAESNNSTTLTAESPARQEWRFREVGTRVWGHYQMDEHFIKCVLGEADPQVTVEDAVKAQEIASGMTR